jgi:hypothetical protein
LIETKLAKLSETANYDNKNRYRLQNRLLNYADKRRQPVDESKIKDLLANRITFKTRIEQEIGNYEEIRNNP